MAKSAKNCLHFCSFYPFFSQVLHTPPLIFRKHRLFRGARKRGFRAPKTPPGGIPGGRKGGFQNIGVSGGGLPLKGLCFGKGGCGAPDPPKGGSGGSGGGGGTPLKGVPRVPQTQKIWPLYKVCRTGDCRVPRYYHYEGVIQMSI